MMRARNALLATLLVVGLTTPALAQKPVKIGVLTPLSPPGDAAAGQFIVRGAKMGAEEVNARGGVLGGRKIELVIEDDSGTPEKGAAGFRKLASQDQAVAVVGQFHSSVMTAVQVLAEQFKVPVFSTQASARQITEKHLNFTFRTHVIDPDRCVMWTRWAKERGFKRVALITENTDYGVGLVDETKKAFASMYPGAELKTIIFDRAVVDLTPQLLEIKNWKPDALFNGGIGTPTYLIAKQAWDVGLTPAVPTLISYDAPSRPEYWKNLGEKGNHASFIVYYHPTMRLTTARRGLPKEVHGRVQGGSDLRRAERLRSGRPARRRAQRGQERQHRRAGQGAAGRQVRGLERHDQLHARRGPVLAAVVPADAGGSVHQAGDAVRRCEDRLPGRSEDGRVDGNAQAIVAERRRWTRCSSPSTCSPGWSSA